MADDPSRGEVAGAQADSSAAQTDARRMVFFMIGSCQPLAGKKSGILRPWRGRNGQRAGHTVSKSCERGARITV
ncbi:hypothetical protein [Achromobacter mucicolens]|uniref:hypothetical protein n=1 Tax=Achromobacter mucicolens TaxID=1389922 RepID=UPI00142D7C20|nr:hypothetical protein [Achromobacter mucicolens]